MVKDNGQFDPTQLEFHAYNSSLFSGSGFQKEVKKLAKSPEYFKKFVRYHHFSNSESKLYYTIANIPDALLNDKEFVVMCSGLVLKLVVAKINNKCMYGTKRTIDIINKAWKILDEENRTKIFDSLIKGLPSMYSYVKRSALEIICDCVKDEQTARTILTNNFTVLSKEQIDKLLKLIPNAQNDKEIAKKLKKSAYFTVAFENINIDTDHTKKMELLKTIIEKPSLLKKLNIKITVTLDDLKALPPGQRFALLNGMFANLFERFVSNTNIKYYLSNDRALTPNGMNGALSVLTRIFSRDAWLQHVSLDNIKEEDIKELLFSKAINSNDTVSKWFDNYKEYIRIKTVLSPLLSQLNKLF